MKYYIKQSVFSWNEKFAVKDQYGNDQFYVEGSLFSIPKNFTIYDMNHNPVVTIEKQLFRWLQHFDVKTNNETVTLKRNFTFFYTSISILGRQWTLEGDFWGHNYRVIEGNHPIMTLSKHWFTWGDSYELDVKNPSDAALCLAIVIVVDRIIAEAKNN